MTYLDEATFEHNALAAMDRRIATPQPKSEARPEHALEPRYGRWLVVDDAALVLCRCMQCGSEHAIGLKALLERVPPCPTCDLNRHAETASKLLTSLGESAERDLRRSDSTVTESGKTRRRAATTNDRDASPTSATLEPSVVEALRAAIQRFRSTVQRNVEIQRRAVAGESVDALAAAFGMSPKAVKAIIRKRASLTSVAAGKSSTGDGPLNRT